MRRRGRSVERETGEVERLGEETREKVLTDTSWCGGKSIWRKMTEAGEGGKEKEGKTGKILFIASLCISFTRSFFEMKKLNSCSGCSIERI